MELASEYKYGYLLSKCKCGNKFLMKNSESSKCDYCINPIGKCTACHDVFNRTPLNRDFCSDCYVQYPTKNPPHCPSCGGSDLMPFKDLCVGCTDLGDRGNYTTNISVTGTPVGVEEGVCIECENLLFKISGSDCVCHGCDIEPLYRSSVKPARH